MNVLLIVVLTYAISIPAVFLLDAGIPEETSGRGIYDRAAGNFPRFSGMFWFAKKLMSAIHSPAIVLVVLLCLPLIVFKHRHGDKAYSDPCFQIIPDHILEPNQRIAFTDFRDQLLELGFYSEGIYKYRQRKLSELVEYFVSRTGTAITVYCIHGEFQICVASFTKDGNAVVTNGLPKERISAVEEKGTRTDQFRRTCIASTNPNAVIETHIKEFTSQYSEKPFRVNSENWKQAFIYLERLKCLSETSEKDCPALNWNTVSFRNVYEPEENHLKNVSTELTSIA